jgi:hypothetical protein
VSQLSLLTKLVLHQVGAAMVPAVVDVATQLTGLKELELLGTYDLADPALLHLTALTALERLEFCGLQTSMVLCKTVSDSGTLG